MVINKANFAFALDTLNTLGCSGWYVRKDNIDDFFIVSYLGKEMPVAPLEDRKDVENAGFGKSRCGYNVKFEEPLDPDTEIVFRSAQGDILYRTIIFDRTYTPDAMSKRMIRMVEPFVEMDIAKVRASLMDNIIYDRYHKLFKETLALRTAQELKDALVEILADVKTTMHLLCAAYLDYTRYKEPDFLVSLPQFCPDVTTEFEIDMKGDITGSNWSEPVEHGRWTYEKSRSSVLMPNPGSGDYFFQIKVRDEKASGDLDRLRIYVNGAKVAFQKNNESFPCVLTGEFSIGNSPFLALHFQFDSSERQLPPDKRNLRSILVENLKFIKK